MTVVICLALDLPSLPQAGHGLACGMGCFHLGISESVGLVGRYGSDARTIACVDLLDGVADGNLAASAIRSKALDKEESTP